MKRGWREFRGGSSTAQHSCAALRNCNVSNTPFLVPPLGVRMHRFRIVPLLAGVALTSVAIAAEAQTLDSLTLAGFRWRTVGPANFEGRVADIAGIPGPSRTFFVATAGGGIW